MIELWYTPCNFNVTLKESTHGNHNWILFHCYPPPPCRSKAVTEERPLDKLVSVIQSTFLGIALAFMLVGPLPGVNGALGFGQSALAADDSWTFGECMWDWSKPAPYVKGFWKQTLCNLLKISTLATGVAGIVDILKTTLLKRGIKAAVKQIRKLPPIRFTIPKRVLWMKIPEPPKGPAGIEIVINPADVADKIVNFTQKGIIALITAGAWGIVDRGCKCWLGTSYSEG